MSLIITLLFSKQQTKQLARLLATFQDPIKLSPYSSRGTQVSAIRVSFLGLCPQSRANTFLSDLHSQPQQPSGHIQNSIFQITRTRHLGEILLNHELCFRQFSGGQVSPKGTAALFHVKLRCQLEPSWNHSHVIQNRKVRGMRSN